MYLYYKLNICFIQTYFNYFIMILFFKFTCVASATTFIFYYCYNAVKANETFAWDISLPLLIFFNHLTVNERVRLSLTVTFLFAKITLCNT